MEEIMQWLSTTIAEVLGSLMIMLPKSPFLAVIQYLGQVKYLGWLNWCFPVGDIIKVTYYWCMCVLGFYAWQIVLRWIKICSD